MRFTPTSGRTAQKRNKLKKIAAGYDGVCDTNGRSARSPAPTVVPAAELARVERRQVMKTNARSLAFAFLGAMLLAAAAVGCGGKVGGKPCGGACGAGQVCQSEQCVCSAGLLSCGGSCVASNAAHCGNCSTTCTGTDVCNAGTCQSSCPGATMQCSDGSCVSPTGGDAMHCGGCNPCPAGATCSAGVCSSVTGTAGTGGSSMGGSTGTGGAGGTGGSTVACTPLGTIPRRLWRPAGENGGAAGQDLLP